MNERVISQSVISQPVRQPLERPAPRLASAVVGRDREFLPAALEILETPAPPMPVLLMLTICAFFAAALIWSFVGRLDVYAVAPGKIEVAGHAKVLQPLEPGKVAAIHVENGQRVKAGDLLIELDPAEAGADAAAQRAALDANLAEISRREAAIEIASAALRAGDSEGAQEDLPQRAAIAKAATGARDWISFARDAPAAARSRESAVLTADLLQLAEALNSLEKQISQKAATRKRLDMSIAYQNTLIDTLTQRVATRQEAIDLKVGTKTNLFDAKEELEHSQSALASDQGQLIETAAAIRELESEATKVVSQFIADNENKRADAERRAEEARQGLVKVEARLRRTRLLAPIDGVVRQLGVTTVGQTVTTGQELVVITPSDAPLEVEALVANLDIGFVKPGQDVVIKVDAFPFTRFGVLHGRIARLSSAAVAESQAKRALADASAPINAANDGAGAVPGETGSFVFPVTVAFDETAMTIGGARVPLAPGMTVAAEIKTGERRAIDYLLSPLAKVASEAMRER